MSLTTVDIVKLYLNKETLETLEESIVNMLILHVDGLINNYCGWTLLATDYTDKVYSGNGNNIIDSGVFPINSIDEVRIRETDGTFTDITLSVEFTEEGWFFLHPSAETTTFPLGEKNIYCTFNAGYSTIPSELENAATYLVVSQYNKVINEMIGIESQRFDKNEVKVDAFEIPYILKVVLDRYRKVTLV